MAAVSAYGGVTGAKFEIWESWEAAQAAGRRLEREIEDQIEHAPGQRGVGHERFGDIQYFVQHGFRPILTPFIVAPYG